jgi:acetyl esterase/lipase
MFVLYHKVIKGVDGNDIKLYIHYPKGNTAALPCVLHTHGGGMSILEASDINYVEWRRHLAAQGMICIGVEFRNAAGKLGPFPFPAGLNDCYSALEYVFENREALNVSKIVISGESGGGNFSLATCMKAKKEGKLSMVAGVYAQCPYIAGPKAYSEQSLTSMHENNGYFLDLAMMAPFALVYCGLTEDALAWPSFSTVEDLKGLPPHCISVNELDPLRDEGKQWGVRRTIHPSECRVTAECAPV